MKRATHILQEAFGNVKVVWQRGDEALLHAPHRPDRKPSLHVYVARNGNYRVHDYATGEDLWLDEYVKRYAGRDIAIAKTGNPRPKPKRKDDPDLDWLVQKLGLLDERNWDYTGHGFRYCMPPRNVVKVAQTVHPRVRKGDTAILWTDPDGKPSGVQIRASNPRSRSRYWWAVPTPLKTQLSASEWHDEVVIAEGMFKAQLAAQALSAIRQRDLQTRFDRKGIKRRAEWSTGYVALTSEAAITHALDYLDRLPTRVTLMLDGNVAEALRKPSNGNFAILNRWVRVIAALIHAGKHVSIVEQGNRDINDTVRIAGSLFAARAIFYDRKRTRLPALPLNLLHLAIVPGTAPEHLAALWRLAWHAGAEYAWDRSKASMTLRMPASYAKLMQVSGVTRRTAVEWLRRAKSDGAVTTDGKYWTLTLRKLYPHTPDSNTLSALVRKIEVKKLTTLGKAITAGSSRKPLGSYTVRHYYAAALIWTGASISAAARASGLARSTIRRLLHRVRNRARLKALWVRTSQMLTAYFESRRQRWYSLLLGSRLLSPGEERWRSWILEQIERHRKRLAAWFASSTTVAEVGLG